MRFKIQASPERKGNIIMKKEYVFLATVAALATGAVVVKMFADKNPEKVATVKQSCSEKLNRASVACAGALKTGSEKLSETMNNILAASKEKGEKISTLAKEKGESFKSDIKNLKDMVVSINNKDSGYAEVTDAQGNNTFTFDEEGVEGEITEFPEEGSEAL